MTENLINRITYYLSSGGLFNPELADHLAVRNLLIECREALAQRTWVGLTDEEKQEWIDAMPYDPEPRHCMILVNVIEVKLKEKNT